jgi:(5-formylfuran-3-yl)methyl phosphate synthase
MRLLVSVANAADASAALAGGADFIDAKDPRTGALGAVSLGVLHEIRATVGTARPVTAAIGDATDEAAIERAAFEFAAAGAAYVKVGFAGVASAARVVALAAAARRGVVAGSDRRAALIIAAYADLDASACVAPGVLVDVAARTGARGVLLDTADKNGPGLRALVNAGPLAAYVTRAHDNGLLVALAGKLGADDLRFVREAGADIAGVRGAACEGGRAGRVAADRVRELITVLEAPCNAS